MATAHANPLVYLGAGATINSVNASDANGYARGYANFPDLSGTSWQGYIGVRPFSPLAIEASYLDLGSADISYTSTCFTGFECHSTRHSDAKALTGSLLGFLPLHSPNFEAFARAGVANIQINRNGTDSFTGLFHVPVFGLFSYNEKNTVFCWGAGLQLHHGVFGGRLEYEQIEKANTGVIALSVFVNLKPAN